jgi:hypothetical protein
MSPLRGPEDKVVIEARIESQTSWPVALDRRNKGLPSTSKKPCSAGEHCVGKLGSRSRVGIGEGLLAQQVEVIVNFLQLKTSRAGKDGYIGASRPVRDSAEPILPKGPLPA